MYVERDHVAGGLGERAGPRRLSTRGRIHVATAVLAAAFAAGFVVQLAILERMRGALDAVEELDEGKRIALELEQAVRDRFLSGQRGARDGARPSAAPADGARVEGLAAELEAHVRDADARDAVVRIRAATAELERLLGAARPLPARPEAPLSPGVQAAAYRLVSEVEDRADDLIRRLQEADAAACAAVSRVRRSTQRVVIGFLIAFPLLAAAVAFRLSRSVARPLRIIGEGAARIAAGDLSTRVDAGGPEEFDVLAAQVNAMAATLKRNQEELVRAETLAGLGRMAAGIAHEINDPLQVLLGYLSLHRDRVGGALGRDLGCMEREATRCREIVGSLLQLARPIVPSPAVPVDLRALGVDVARALRIALGEGAGAVRVEGEATALASPLAVRQILVNLARNAAEAAGPAGEVALRVGSDGRHARVTVADSGPGVPPCDRARVFDPFFTTKPTGTGLGLPMARALAGALGGDLALEPDDGGGARFTLRLPIAREERRT